MKVKKITEIGLIVAIMFILGLTPIGTISFGTINITLLAYPVIIGTLCLGLSSGLILGFFFGLICFIKTFIYPSALTAPLLFTPIKWYGPILYVILMIVPRMIVPLTVYLVNKIKVKKPIRYGIASVLGCLTNTVLFLGTMYIFFYKDISANYAIDSKAVLLMLLGIALSNGVIEAVVSLVCVPVAIAVDRVSKKLHPGNKLDG